MSIWVFLSTLSLRRATLQASVLADCGRDFYPRSPCGERHDCFCRRRCQFRFLSTLSLRRATSRIDAANARARNFYPRSPCGERQTCRWRQTPAGRFLSTLSLRRATQRLAESQQQGAISIHALLAESDPASALCCARTRYFYPRSPCGERQEVRLFFASGRINFYPRSPCGERLVADSQIRVPVFISIHALLAESDIFYRVYIYKICDFYPRSPCGERPQSIVLKPIWEKFLSTLSLRRATMVY